MAPPGVHVQEKRKNVARHGDGEREREREREKRERERERENRFQAKCIYYILASFPGLHMQTKTGNKAMYTIYSLIYLSPNSGPRLREIR